jgi:hypothetical protein
VKVGCQLLAILTVGILSTNAALAFHHSNHARVTAHGYGHSSKPSAEGSNSDKDGVTSADHEHHGATLGVDPNLKEGPGPLDTSITVNRPPMSLRNPDMKTSVLGTTKSVGLTGLGWKRQHELNHSREVHAGFHPDLRRNAIGVLVEPNHTDQGNAELHNKTEHEITNDQNAAKYDKAIEPGNTIAPHVITSTTNPITHGPNAGPTTSKTTIEELSPNALSIARTSSLSLSGTDSIRPRIDIGAVGGPAPINKININSGVLSGNMFHPKQR